MGFLGSRGFPNFLDRFLPLSKMFFKLVGVPADASFLLLHNYEPHLLVILLSPMSVGTCAAPMDKCQISEASRKKKKSFFDRFFDLQLKLEPYRNFCTQSLHQIAFTWARTLNYQLPFLWLVAREPPQALGVSNKGTQNASFGAFKQRNAFRPPPQRFSTKCLFQPWSFQSMQACFSLVSQHKLTPSSLHTFLVYIFLYKGLEPRHKSWS